MASSVPPSTALILVASDGHCLNLGRDCTGPDNGFVYDHARLTLDHHQAFEIFGVIDEQCLRPGAGMRFIVQVNGRIVLNVVLTLPEGHKPSQILDQGTRHVASWRVGPFTDNYSGDTAADTHMDLTSAEIQLPIDHASPSWDYKRAISIKMMPCYRFRRTGASPSDSTSKYKLNMIEDRGQNSSKAAKRRFFEPFMTNTGDWYIPQHGPYVHCVYEYVYRENLNQNALEWHDAHKFKPEFDDLLSQLSVRMPQQNYANEDTKDLCTVIDDFGPVNFGPAEIDLPMTPLPQIEINQAPGILTEEDIDLPMTPLPEDLTHQAPGDYFGA